MAELGFDSAGIGEGKTLLAESRQAVNYMPHIKSRNYSIAVCYKIKLVTHSVT